MKVIGKALLVWLASPAARRFEAALLVGAYEAVRVALGHA